MGGACRDGASQDSLFLPEEVEFNARLASLKLEGLLILLTCRNHLGPRYSSCGPGPATSTSPGSLSGLQTLRTRPKYPGCVSASSPSDAYACGNLRGMDLVRWVLKVAACAITRGFPLVLVSGHSDPAVWASD